MWTLAISMLIQYLPLLLSKVGVISPQMSNLITGLGSAIPGVITSLSSGQPVSQDFVTLLKAFQVEITALQANTSLDAGDLALAATLNAAITAALVGYEAATVKDDPSTLTPLPTDLTATA